MTEAADLSAPTTKRDRLPWQRHGVCVSLLCDMGGNEFKFDAHFNFYEDGRLGEMFARPFKTGAHMEALLDKFCIAVSRLLQHGMRIDEFWASVDDGMTGNRRDIFSAVICGGVEAEQQKMRELAIAAGAGHA